jgi:acetyl-CoA carboxylase biotin carboxyl carrier protein
MTEQRTDQETGSTDLAELREQAQQFASQLNGSLRSLRMRLGEASIEVEWQDTAAANGRDAGLSPHGTAAGNGRGNATEVPPVSAAGADATAGPGTEGDEAFPDGAFLVSPMVGTFYRSSSPGADPFVEVGDLVDAGQVIGIVEAMKLMNSITAEVSGKVARILVEDAQPVEYGQPLIALMPDESTVPTAGV